MLFLLLDFLIIVPLFLPQLQWGDFKNGLIRFYVSLAEPKQLFEGCFFFVVLF